jgi:hypothetical protein
MVLCKRYCSAIKRGTGDTSRNAASLIVLGKEKI